VLYGYTGKTDGVLKLEIDKNRIMVGITAERLGDRVAVRLRKTFTQNLD
jgi:hypothetical protein